MISRSINSGSSTGVMLLFLGKIMTKFGTAVTGVVLVLLLDVGKLVGGGMV